MISLLITATAANASPGYDFVCYNRGFSASIGLDLEWSSAFLKVNSVETKLDAQSSSGPGGQFSFSNGNYTFRGFAPTGRLELPDGGYADCYQSRDSLTAVALYGAEDGYRWPSFNAPGLGFQTVRAMPSPQSEKIASLEAGTPVMILENTGEFLDGFFWFKIALGDSNEGYIWGALVCSNADDPILNMVVRHCD